MYRFRQLLPASSSSLLRIIVRGSVDPFTCLSQRRTLVYPMQPRDKNDDEEQATSTSSSSSSRTSVTNGPHHQQQQQHQPILPSSMQPPVPTPIEGTMAHHHHPLHERPAHFIDVSPLAASIRERVRDYTSQFQIHHSHDDHDDGSIRSTNNKAIRLVGILATSSTIDGNNNHQIVDDNTSDTPKVTTYIPNQSNQDDNDNSNNKENNHTAITFENDSELYSEQIARTCVEDGIHYQVWRCPTAKESPKDIQNMIHKANEDPNVDGIIVFYPIFPNILEKTKNNNNTKNNAEGLPYKNPFQGVYYKTHDCHLRDLVATEKDVEGLRGTKWYHNPRRLQVSPEGRRREQQQQQQQQPSRVYPCTARAVEAVLEYCHRISLTKVVGGNDGENNEEDSHTISSIHSSSSTTTSTSSSSSSSFWKGQTVSIVNRSEIVGRPLAVMLASNGAKVYSIDDTSTVLKFWPRGGRLQRCQNLSLQECLSQSTILVTGVPHEEFKIPISYIRPNTTVVNVSEFHNVNEEDLMNRTDITYIPQVGKVTVAILEENLIQLHRQRHHTHDQG